MTTNEKSAQDRDLQLVLGSFYLVIASALVIAATTAGISDWSFRAAFCALLWAIAFVASGTCVGFLFCIPKVVQSKSAKSTSDGYDVGAAPAPDQGYQSQVNNNLIEISDWLTKIIVGLGLINLKELPHFVLQVARIVADSLATGSAAKGQVALAVAIIVTFLTMGMLFGYLFTRLYLAPAFIRADLDGVKATRQLVLATSGSVESLQQSLGALTAKVNQMLFSRSRSKPETSVTETTAHALAGSIAAIAPPAAVAPQAPVIPAAPAYEGDLLRLAESYNNFRSDSWEERVRVKNDLAKSMGLIIDSNPKSREWVVDAALKEKNGGLVAGLAAAVNAEPQPGDGSRLFKVARISPSRHTCYRVATAIGRVFEAQIASSAHVSEAMEILSYYYKHDPDKPLEERIIKTMAQIGKATGQNLKLSRP